MKFKYLKHISLPYYDGDVIWTICPFTGSLLKSNMNTNKHKKHNIPIKVSKAIEFCNQPFFCNLNTFPLSKFEKSNLAVEIIKMHETFIKIGQKRFFLIRLYACFKNNLFKSTIEAIANINNLKMQIELKHQLCLPRAFLAAKVSKSFDDNGVIFIGAFLPTGHMHAWIIENGIQPDPNDRYWINYRPLLAFYF